jgi:arsenate reductase (thioredoxin)
MADRTVLFVCVENACRSLMAEAMFNADPAPGWSAVSAGTSPAPRPNRRTGPMLAEIGLPAPSHPPRLLTPELLSVASVRVSMGCLDDRACPAQFKEVRWRDWALPDPSGLDDEGFREVRDRLVTLVGELRTELLAVVPERAVLPRSSSR